MFSSSATMTYGRPGHFAQAYRSIAAETGITDASPHRLVTMLYDGFLDAVTEARGAMRSGDLERKGRAIGKAVRIVEEGLRAGLNLKQGGRLASDLNELYRYVGRRMTEANLRNDEAALDECQRLVQPLREAWITISTPSGSTDA
jgi:flagellar protein FliS